MAGYALDTDSGQLREITKICDDEDALGQVQTRFALALAARRALLRVDEGEGASPMVSMRVDQHQRGDDRVAVLETQA